MPSPTEEDIPDRPALRMLRFLELGLLLLRATPAQREETIQSLASAVAARPAAAPLAPPEDGLVWFTRQLLDLDEPRLAALERLFLEQREYEGADFIRDYRTLTLDQRARFAADFVSLNDLDNARR